MLDVFQHLVVLMNRKVTSIRLDFAKKALHHPDAMRIYAGGRQAHNLIEDVMPLDACALEGEKR